MDTQERTIKVRYYIGTIKVIENKELNWAEPSMTPGEACANCLHYGIYEEPQPIEHNEDGDAIYAAPLTFNGTCTQPILQDMFVIDIPSNYHCPNYRRRVEDAFVDDTITEHSEGREL